VCGKMQSQLIERALEISRKRRGYLEEMRNAIRSGDKNQVFEIAKKLTRIDDDEKKCNRTDTCLN
jgi:hypothetical protein